MAGGWRYWTTPDCVRHWRWFAQVGRPERPLFGPCAKAAIVGLPLAFGPPAVMWPAPEYVAPGPAFAAGPGLPPPPPAPAAWFEGWGPYGGGEVSGPFVSPSPTAYSPNAPPGVEQPGPILAACCGEVAGPLPETAQPPPGVLRSFPPEQQAVPEPASLLLLAVGAGAAVLAARGRA